MKTRFLFLSAVALSGFAQAQTILPTNLLPNNGGSVNWGLFFDVASNGPALTITELRTASNAGAGAPVEFEVLTFAGSTLGGNVTTGPTTDLNGWTNLGLASGLQGPTGSAGVSESIDIPDIAVPAGQTVGVCLLFVTAGPRYFGTGAAPYQVISDSNLTLTTGDSRSTPFSTSGSFFTSRSLCGELTYVGGSTGSLGNSFCPSNPNSTGVAGEITATGSATAADNNLTLTASNLPVGQFGIFVTSASTTAGSTVGAGVLCLGGQTGRYNAPGQILQADPSGEFSLALNLTLTPLPSSVVSVMAGDTRSWQAWHRDFAGMSLTSNFTNGVTITFN